MRVEAGGVGLPGGGLVGGLSFNMGAGNLA